MQKFDAYGKNETCFQILKQGEKDETKESNSRTEHGLHSSPFVRIPHGLREQA
jgi:hypothetical protein